MDPTHFQVFSGDRQGSLPMMTVGRLPVTVSHAPRWVPQRKYSRGGDREGPLGFHRSVTAAKGGLQPGGPPSQAPPPRTPERSRRLAATPIPDDAHPPRTAGSHRHVERPGRGAPSSLICAGPRPDRDRACRRWRRGCGLSQEVCPRFLERARGSWRSASIGGGPSGGPCERRHRQINFSRVGGIRSAIRGVERGMQRTE